MIRGYKNMKQVAQGLLDLADVKINEHRFWDI